MLKTYVSPFDRVDVGFCPAQASRPNAGISPQVLPQTLRHLNISRNAIASLEGIEGLTSLQWLDASCNRIQVLAADCAAETCCTRSACPHHAGLETPVLRHKPQYTWHMGTRWDASGTDIKPSCHAQDTRHLAGCRNLRYADLAHNLLVSTQGLEGDSGVPRHAAADDAMLSIWL